MKALQDDKEYLFTFIKVIFLKASPDRIRLMFISLKMFMVENLSL